MDQFTIPNLPPVGDLESLRLAVTNALSKLVGQLNSMPTTVDGSNTRVVNVATPTGPNDAVNKRYLEDRLDDLAINTGSFTGQAGASPFAVIREGYAALTFDSLDIPQDKQVTFIAPSIDETDVNWCGSSSVTSTDTKMTVTLRNTSRFGQRVYSIAVTSGGTNYSHPLLVFGGGGTAAAGSLTISGGVVTKATITNPGVQYSFGTATLTNTVSGTLTGSGASFVVGLSDFLPDDYVVWNDPGNYEINRLSTFTTSVVGTVTNTIYNFYTGTATVSGTATVTRNTYYGSTRSAHVNMTFYRVTPSVFVANVKAGPTAKVDFLHANKCVLAANSPATNTSSWVNLNHASDAIPAPGLRTMNGAAYTIGIATDTITVGQHADFRIKVQAWESVRCVYGFCGTAPGGAALAANVIYISPNGSQTGLIDRFSISAGGTLSYNTNTAPDGRNMPYHNGTWVVPTETGQHWPPNVLPPASGTGSSVLFQPDGYIDMVITSVGTGPTGARLVATIQT